MRTRAEPDAPSPIESREGLPLDEQGDALQNLKRIKQGLSNLSLLIGLVELAQMIFLAINGFLVMQAAQHSFDRDLAEGLTPLLMFFSGASFCALLLLVFIFERSVRSARIYSAEFSDQMGWYTSHEVSSDGSTASSEPLRRSVQADRTEAGLGMQSRILLREVAENSYLPLSRGDNSPFLYAALSLFLVVCHFTLAYVTVFNRAPSFSH